jgi:PIN domain nuclease of toxin-antitoxin system
MFFVSSYLLDTHAWVWLIQDDRRLSHANSQLMEDARVSLELFVSVISVWEVSLLVQRGRLQLERSLESWLDLSFTGWAVQMADLTREIAVESTRLPGDLHRDPSDRILAATARAEDMTLLTRDTNLLTYAKQGHLRARRV